MVRYTDKNGKTTGWLSEKPSDKELSKLSIDQLWIIARNKSKHKNGVKKVLLDFLSGVTLKV